VLIFRRTIVLVQHPVSSLSLGDCSVHRLREVSRNLCTEQVFSLNGQGLKHGNMLQVIQRGRLIIATLLPSTDLQSPCHLGLLGNMWAYRMKQYTKHRLVTFKNLNSCK